MHYEGTRLLLRVGSYTISITCMIKGRQNLSQFKLFSRPYSLVNGYMLMLLFMFILQLQKCLTV